MNPQQPQIQPQYFQMPPPTTINTNLSQTQSAFMLPSQFQKPSPNSSSSNIVQSLVHQTIANHAAQQQQQQHQIVSNETDAHLNGHSHDHSGHGHSHDHSGHGHSH